MAQDKKFVEEITPMDQDFTQWYTDVIKKAELVDYSSVRLHGHKALRVCDLGEYPEGTGFQVQADRARERLYAHVHP